MELQPGFFDLSNRLEALSAQGDPLEQLNATLEWAIFKPSLEKAFSKQRKNAAGRKPFPRLLMFKVLVLQNLYNLSDAQTEYQIKDRLSFMRFLGLDLEDRVPDEKTIWAFRERLIEANVLQKLFERFDRYLNTEGYCAQKGTIIDASLMPARIQRNSDDEKELLKAGAVPVEWVKNPNQLRQKDCDARWAKKDNRSIYGYKNHVIVDVKYKLIRRSAVTNAAIADVYLFPKLLQKIDNTDSVIYADKGYLHGENERKWEQRGYLVKIPHKKNDLRGCSKAQNRAISSVRIRIEHVFCFMKHAMNQRVIRSIGIDRARGKITLINLVYNLCRYKQLIQGKCV